MSGKNDTGRRPFEYIVIYRDICGTAFAGTCPCETLSATRLEKGFGTINTCGDTDSFTRSSRADYFCSPENFTTAHNLGVTCYPFLQSTSHSSAKINPAGSDENSTPLGKRATLSVSLIDATSDDLHQDPYYAERISGAARYDAVGYEPDERSTFFAKYFRRNQYLWGRQLDWVTGYIQDDGSLVDSITRTFVIDGHTGPDEQGRVSISAKDVLSLTNADKAKAPAVSIGQLSAPMTISDTSLTLKAGQGVDYPASGKIKVGKEAMSYTGKSTDTLTGLTRGIDGSTAEEHKIDDTVQVAWVTVNQKPDAIIYDLLSNFTTIPASMLNTTQWAAEVTNKAWLNHTYSATIYEPTGVGKLLGDIARQMQFYPFVDERANDIKIAAISPLYAPGDSNHQLNDTDNILADSLTVEEQNDQVITRLYMHVNPINWADKLDDAKNYSATLVDWSEAEEDGNHRRSAKAMEVFGYWLTPTLADLLAQNVTQQFGKAPRKISFDLDGKDSDVKLSDFMTLDHRKFTDIYGLRQPVLAQAISVSETKKGTTWAVEAMNYSHIVTGDQQYNVPIPVNVNNVILKELFDSTYPNADWNDIISNGKIITFYPSSSDVIIGGGGAGLNAGALQPEWLPNQWPYGLVAGQLVLDGNFKPGVTGFQIRGAGGHGGGTFSPYGGDRSGGSGAPALYVQIPLTLKGTIIIAGGGGGGGASNEPAGSGTYYKAPGGGGAGVPGGAGGAELNVYGSSGTKLTGGSGGNNNGAIGGKGGNPGQAGDDGTGTTSPPAPAGTGITPGGAAGASVFGWSYITEDPGANITYYGAKVG